MAPTPSKMSSTLRSNSLHIGKIEGLSIRPGNYIEMNCALPFTAYAHPLSCRSFTHPTEPLQVSQARPLNRQRRGLGGLPQRRVAAAMAPPTAQGRPPRPPKRGEPLGRLMCPLASVKLQQSVGLATASTMRPRLDTSSTSP